MYSLHSSLASLLLFLSTLYPSVLASPVSGSLDLQTLNTDDISPQELTKPTSTYDPHCSIYLGRNLNYESCSEALAKISRNATPITFGDRNTGAWDVALPRRYLSDSGQCAIDVKADSNGPRRDVSNALQLTDAASAVLRTCVDPRLANSGGFVKHLGARYKGLYIEMKRYDPVVHCHDGRTIPPPSYDSCKQLIDIMQWSERMIGFGFPWQSGVEVPVPYFLNSADGQCKMLVANKLPPFNEPPVEMTTWANIWAGAVAANEMCVKQGSSGNATPTSLHGSLLIFFFRGVNPPPEVLSSLNISAADLRVLSAPNATVADLNATASILDA